MGGVCGRGRKVLKNDKQVRTERERESGVKKVVFKPEALKYGVGRVELRGRKPQRRSTSQCMPSLCTPRLRKTIERPAAEFQQQTRTANQRWESTPISVFGEVINTQHGSGGT